VSVASGRSKSGTGDEGRSLSPAEIHGLPETN
jgi:hypothetical protein